MANERTIGVHIEHVATIPMDLNGNPIDPSISALPTVGKSVVAGERVIIRVEHANELSFYAKPGMGARMAQAAANEPAFWSVALKALVASGSRDNFDKASMGAAYEAVRLQKEKKNKCGRVEKP